MNTLEIDPAIITEASQIVIPSGRDYERCLEAFESEYSLSAPRFEDRRLSLVAENTKYRKVKGKDIPAYVAEGFADIGLTGTDVCEEHIPPDSNLLYAAIGKPMCTFNILLPEASADEFINRLGDPEAEPLLVATTYPRFLSRCIKKAQIAGETLNIAISPFKPAGSAEALPGWVSEAVADVVETGETAQANCLLIGPRLADISPAVVWRNPSMSPAPLSRTAYGVDESLTTRVLQANDRNLTSYTLERLRNPNQAVKDYGEESAESLDAVIRNCQSATDELADLIFASLVLSCANGGSVRLADVIRILEERNNKVSIRELLKV